MHQTPQAAGSGEVLLGAGAERALQVRGEGSEQGELQRERPPKGEVSGDIPNPSQSESQSHFQRDETVLIPSSCCLLELLGLTSFISPEDSFFPTPKQEESSIFSLQAAGKGLGLLVSKKQEKLVQ